MLVRTEKKERRISVTWDRPPLNVLDLSVLSELDHALSICACDPDIDVVVVQGSGNRAFSAGVDIRDHTKEKVPEMLQVVHGVVRKLCSLPQVTVAAVRGACLGGGCEIASSCDLIVATEESSFATPEIRVGCYPPVAMARFSRLIGYHRAAEMILTGRRFSAHEAQAMGLVNQVFSADQFTSGLERLLQDLSAQSGAVLRLTVKGLRTLSSDGFEQALQYSEKLYRDELLRTADVEEGITAFLEKRPPAWSHR